jgi:regulatory LuxR family protein
MRVQTRFDTAKDADRYADPVPGIKWQTVATYVQRIYEKLHVHSRREVITRAASMKGRRVKEQLSERP